MHIFPYFLYVLTSMYVTTYLINSGNELLPRVQCREKGWSADWVLNKRGGWCRVVVSLNVGHTLVLYIGVMCGYVTNYFSTGSSRKSNGW